MIYNQIVTWTAFAILAMDGLDVRKEKVANCLGYKCVQENLDKAIFFTKIKLM